MKNRNKQKKTLRRKEGKSQQITRLVNESLAFQVLRILYPVTMMSQEKKEKKEKEKVKTPRFFLLPEVISTCHLHGVLYSTTTRRNLGVRSQFICVTSVSHHAGTINQFWKDYSISVSQSPSTEKSAWLQ